MQAGDGMCDACRVEIDQGVEARRAFILGQYERGKAFDVKMYPNDTERASCWNSLIAEIDERLAQLKPFEASDRRERELQLELSLNFEPREDSPSE
jgi:hypothetical protein